MWKKKNKRKRARCERNTHTHTHTHTHTRTHVRVRSSSLMRWTACAEGATQTRRILHVASRQNSCVRSAHTGKEEGGGRETQKEQQGGKSGEENRKHTPSINSMLTPRRLRIVEDRWREQTRTIGLETTACSSFAPQTALGR